MMDTGARANEVLLMIAAICIHRAGGSITFTRQEWDALVASDAGEAVMFDDGSDDDGTIKAWLGTPEQAAEILLRAAESVPGGTETLS